MTDVVIRCTVCGSSGVEYWQSMGPADNMDVDWGWDVCSNCGGSGLELIEAEFTEDQVAA